MKIALVVHDHDPGFGQGRYTVELAGRLARDHDVHVFASRFAAPLPANVTYQRVRAVRASAMLTILSFVRASEALLRGRRYDIVHAQGLTCWRANIITAHICNASRQNTSDQTPKSRLFAAMSGHLEKSFYHANPRAKVIGVSKLVAKEIRETCGLPTVPAIIHHGVDSGHFRPAANEQERNEARRMFHLTTDGWQWLFVGEAVKGLARVIHQLAEFTEANLLVISRSDLSPYQRLASSLGVTDRIQFYGPSPDVHLAFRAADVFIYPSAYDAFGMVVAEAMSSGLPVIASRTIGAAEWIQDGQNGLLFDPVSDDSLSICLKRLRSDHGLAKRMGEAARITALQHSWDACARSTLAVYEQAIREGSPVR